ncbi:Retinoic acid induced 16-like protein-domain-containing protein [Coniochaeta sp. 2T2.1]|nr:Retinoic acid induced 16-like protein-domain-containing protein [Coniochaeta sp. 2T2.1]
MDFWSRLLTPLSSGSSRKDYARDPIRRLHRFEKEYSQLLQTWRNSSNLANDDDAAENIEIRLQELTNILSDESRRPLPHPCITFASRKQIYIPVAKVATTSYNEWIVKEAVLFFATLVESEEEAFVENDTFSASLTNLLVRITGANSLRLGADTEARVVELAFNITTKIRLEPEILSAWFKSRQGQQAKNDNDEQDEHEKFAGRTQRQDFPLFYLLMDYIHHDGKVGGFARTGLLYIIEAASSSVALEQWIVESDLSTLMATGLGALYSQLSRKLVIDHPANDLPPILALSDYEHPKSNYEIVSSCSFEFQSHLDTFLSHLLFWQDVLNHCRSVEVKSTLLEHFQVIFLQQLLYPSLLESSDIDGGSSVAVLTYLRRILESLDHPDMINLILHYLLALPDIVPSASSNTRNSVSAARKRKSMDLATMMAAQQTEMTATPLLFNLVDLILACLRSHSHQTIDVTLQLVSAVLKRHHRYAVITLLHTERVRSEQSHRTVGAHEQELEFLMTLAGVIGGQDNFNEVYENILKDTTVRLEGHPCSLKLVAPKVSINNHKLPAIPDSLPGAPQDVESHTLRPDDPVLNIILDRLSSFFLNPVETNLSLTEAIFDLAVCGFMNIEGWFLRSPRVYTYPSSTSSTTFSPDSAPPPPDSPAYATFQRAQAISHCRARPEWTPTTLPRLLTVLQALVDSVAAYRFTIPRFDDLLQQRREAFQTADTEPAPPPPPRPNALSTPGNATPVRNSDDLRSGSPAPRPSGLEGFAQRILSELGTPSRSGSPRGRKERERERDRSRGEETRTPTPVVPPKEIPLPIGAGVETPSRPGGMVSGRSYSPATATTGGGEVAVSSQLKAFEAVDQGILARRVGMARLGRGKERKVEAIPLRFDKATTSASDGSSPVLGGNEEDAAAGGDGETSSLHAGEREGEIEGGEEEEEDEEEEQTASVSHVLTNVIVLQNFLFELASLVQVRAGLFDEVRFA